MEKNASLLFVCLGNICRSPLGEGIMTSLSDQYGLGLFVDSAGTSAYHLGEKPDKRSIEIAKKNHIDIRGQKSRQLSTSDFDRFDIIFAMDRSNAQQIQSLKKKEQKAQIHLLREFDPITNSLDVPDPYYGGTEGFANCFTMIQRSCENFLRSNYESVKHNS